MHQIYNKNGITVNLVANFAQASTPFYVVKRFDEMAEYVKEKQTYERLADQFGPTFNTFGLAMSSFSDKSQ